MTKEKIINLACHVPNPHDATSLYRGFGPIGHLQRHYPINAYGLSEATLAACQLTDVVFFQRPSSMPELEGIRFMKRMRVPLIVDYDDYLLGVPADNQTSPIYNRPDTQKIIRECLEHADILTVSTGELKSQLGKLVDDKKIRVIPNALDERYFYQSTPGINKSFAWRGGMTHERELRDFAPGMEKSETPISFYGFDPYFLTHQGEDQPTHKRRFMGAWPNPIDFYDSISRASHQLALVPLRDSIFNRCKSNIAALEMIWAGAIPLVPRWEEWKIEGCASYRDVNDFGNQMQELANMPKTWYPEQQKKAWKCVVDRFTLKTTNPLRYDILLELTNNT